MSKKITISEPEFRFKRLTQLFWALEVSFVCMLLIELIGGNYMLAVIIFSLCVILCAIFFIVGKTSMDRAAALMFSMVALTISMLMWTYGGLQDETILGFPVLLLFAAVLGNTRLFVGLFVYIFFTVLAIATSNIMGWRMHQPPQGDLHSATIIVILLVIISYSIWLLSEDLKRMLARMNIENERARQAQKKIEQLVHYDALTNLPNRILARERFKLAVSLSKRESTLVCLMFLDLDDFKAINDTMGHQSGDVFLLETAYRLQAISRDSDTVCRQGGDEFLVVLGGIKSEQSIAIVAEKILQAIRQPVTIERSVVTSTVSIGIAVATSDDFDAVSGDADMAMYHAKELGRDCYAFFDSAMHKRAKESRQLQFDLRTAIDEKQFELYFQAKTELSDNTVVGAEALIRWNHPTRGFVQPLDFIPAAEHSGIIIDISDWVVKEACRQCARWQSLGHGPLSVAVNISPVQFKRGQLLELVGEALKQNSLEASALELEITESLLMNDSSEINTIFSDLHKAGVKLSIDDFGTGYSNLGYLKKFDVSVLKIDGSFVGKILSSPQDKAIVKAIIQMATSLNLKTIAEGVETIEIAELLREMGCDMGQGYFWSRPLSAENFYNLLVENK
ncbi:MAG: diguanylate cyclase (GGDEF)-like protein [Halioglobus sp.]